MVEPFSTLSSALFSTERIAGNLQPGDRPITIVDCTQKPRKDPFKFWNFLLGHLDQVAIFDQHNLQTHEDRRVVAIKSDLLNEWGMEFPVLEQIE